MSVEKSPCHTVHVENFDVFRLDDVTIRAFVSCYVFLNVINSYINSTLCGVELVTENNTITEIYGVVLEESDEVCFSVICVLRIHQCSTSRALR